MIRKKVKHIYFKSFIDNADIINTHNYFTSYSEFFILNCVYLTYSIQYNLKPLKDIKSTELFWYLTYIQFFLVSFGVFLIFSLIKYLMYNKKLKACVKLIKMRSRESKNQ